MSSIATAGVMTMASQSSNLGVCFVAGTLVETADGSMPIEEITIGTIVYAYNTDTDETALKAVADTFVRESSELVHIEVNGEQITTTPEHPFWVPQKGWISAIQLRAGDRLQLLNGKYVVIEQVQHEILETPVIVYNFEVEDFHTYYVSDCAILVHNECDKKGVGGKGWVGDRKWRENVGIVAKGGTITSLNGGIPTQKQAMKLIEQAGGKDIRIDPPHASPNPHTYPHINYETRSGIKGTIKIYGE